MTFVYSVFLIASNMNYENVIYEHVPLIAKMELPDYGTGTFSVESALQRRDLYFCFNLINQKNTYWKIMFKEFFIRLILAGLYQKTVEKRGLMKQSMS